MHYKAKSKVKWKWLGRFISGEVLEIHFARVEKVIKSKKIVRIGSKENPAYLVKSEAGNEALKLHSELGPIERRTRAARKPKMFSAE